MSSAGIGEVVAAVARRAPRRLGLFGLVAVVGALLLAPAAAPPAPAPAHLQLVRGFHFSSGAGSFRSRPSFTSRRPGTARRILRHVARAAAFAAVLHFLFAGSHGIGALFLLILVAGLVFVVARALRRRSAYAGPPYRPRY